MLRNYLTIALRNLRRHPGYAAINIGGLAVGLAACILIGLYVQDELSYDRFHEKGDRIYRVLREFDIPELQGAQQQVPAVLAPAIEESIPAVENVVRTEGWLSPVVKSAKHTSVENGFLWAEDGFFEMFSFPMLCGEAELGRPGTVVLTEEMATEYFPDEDPIGKELHVNEDTLEVTGLMAEVPHNSSLSFDFVGSLNTREIRESWTQNNWITYVLLREGHSKAEVISQIAKVIRANKADQFEGSTGYFIPHLQPITGVHFGRGVSVEIRSEGDIRYVYLFTALAVFILILACINFMNLATARSVERATEVGMRKTLGAQKGQLAAQFLAEATVTSLVAFVLAFLLCWSGLPLLNELAEKELVFGDIFGGFRIAILLGLVVMVGMVAGGYPALVLSRFRPVTVLRGGVQAAQGRRLRKGLVVFQFALSVILIVGTLIIVRQLSFMRNASLGYEPDNLIVVDQTMFLEDRLEAFIQELERLSSVQNVSSAHAFPGQFYLKSMWAPVEPNAEHHKMSFSPVGSDYVETLGLDLVTGRSFSHSIPIDSFSVLVNEATVGAFGWTPQEAIGKRIDGDGTEYTVIGVIEDFHFGSFHEEIGPLTLLPPVRERQYYVAARVTPENLPATLEAMRDVWEQFSDLPFEYSFLADDLAAQYEAEERLATVFAVFAGLAILIACLGLFGLAAYAAETRTKEIGIRKVLGASVPGIVALLSKDFLKLVLVAFVIAAPIAYLAMRRWLENFAYHIDLSVGVFLLAGVLAVVIALLTVSYQAVRAALADPVKSLRYE